MYSNLVKKALQLQELDCDDSKDLQKGSNLTASVSETIESQSVATASASTTTASISDEKVETVEVAKKTFITINEFGISSQFTDSVYHEQCFWAIYLDLDKFASAKKLATELYLNNELPGVKFLTHPIAAAAREKPIFFFTEPISDACFMIFVGETIASKMQHRKQRCNRGYDKFIYCMQKGKRFTYRVPY
jgi:hypothetical protein